MILRSKDEKKIKKIMPNLKKNLGTIESRLVKIYKKQKQISILYPSWYIEDEISAAMTSLS